MTQPQRGERTVRAATGRTTKRDPARRQDIGMEEHLLSHRATVCL
ncbi:hypothetical protein M2158_004946 [Streptomyces sp. SAI-144]|nr:MULTISPECIES: hypothetical protein [unclassified Streptomyces]MDH6436406.1 hypothetical protein [Streptomyces sp. SAI-144]MDH6493255.1 hypothetical protein [Streptomyces sp. SAI-127]